MSSADASQHGPLRQILEAAVRPMQHKRRGRLPLGALTVLSDSTDP
jgi:hypothetical protein